MPTVCGISPAGAGLPSISTCRGMPPNIGGIVVVLAATMAPLAFRRSCMRRTKSTRTSRPTYFRFGRMNADRQQARGVEADVLPVHVHEAAHHEPRPGEQHQRQRELAPR